MPKAQTPIYQKTVAEVLKEFQTTEKGISQKSLENLRRKYGSNTIEVVSKTPWWRKAIEPFLDPLILMLVVAAVLSMFVGEVETGIIFFIIIFLNAGLDFWQSYQAENIVNSLKGFLKKTANVRRDGKILEILSSELLPGDIVLLDEGDAVPADIRLIKTRRLQVNAFALTGESVPQQKSEHPVSGDLPIADQSNMLHMGASIVTGSGEGVVVATGMNTVFGDIANLTSEEEKSETPMQRELLGIAKKNVWMAVIIMTSVFGLSLWLLDKTIPSAVIFCIVVATSMIPQGLPLEVNLSLLMGVFRLGKKNAVVKKLDAVEALGSASVVCTDKTGTLTRNEMNVEWAFGENFLMSIEGNGYLPTAKVLLNDKAVGMKEMEKFQDFFHSLYFNNHARLCEPDETHPEYYVIGDPTEGALRVMGQRLGLDVQAFRERYTEEDEIPFDSTRKMMSTIFTQKKEKDVTVYTKGATESVLERCTHYQDMTTGKVKKMTAKKSQEFLALSESYAKDAYRVLAIAMKTMPKAKKYADKEVEKGLVFLGCVAMMDLPREGVAESFKVASGAHIKTIMITGDNELTAVAIAKKIGIFPEKKAKMLILGGAAIERKSDKVLLREIKESYACIFSRVSPAQKLRIVKLLRNSGEVVAVTGDGINDAPALKKADIGVAMGIIGTSVAKEASQIVLADDSYSTLVYAVEEGRKIYQNLVKTVKSCYTSNFGELFVILSGIFLAGYFHGVQPLTPVQILLIDLVGELAPLIMLTFDPLAKGAMKRPPRNMDRNVLNRVSVVDIILTGLLMGGIAFAAFWGIYSLTGEGKMASTATYLMLIFAQYINILSRRDDGFLISSYLFTNKKLWWSMGITLVIIMGLIYSPIGALDSIGFQPLTLEAWGIVVALMGVMFGFVELKKYLMNKWTVRVFGTL